MNRNGILIYLYITCVLTSLDLMEYILYFSQQNFDFISISLWTIQIIVEIASFVTGYKVLSQLQKLQHPPLLANTVLSTNHLFSFLSSNYYFITRVNSFLTGLFVVLSLVIWEIESLLLLTNQIPDSSFKSKLEGFNLLLSVLAKSLK